MLTNPHRRVIPYSSGGAGSTRKVEPKTGSSKDVEMKSHWSRHVVCMEGEPDTEDRVDKEETFDPHMHWVHLLK